MVEWLHISLSLFKNHIAGNDSSLLLVSHFHTSHHGGQAGLTLVSFIFNFQIPGLCHHNQLFIPQPSASKHEDQPVKKVLFFYSSGVVLAGGSQG